MRPLTNDVGDYAVDSDACDEHGKESESAEDDPRAGAGNASGGLSP